MYLYDLKKGLTLIAAVHIDSWLLKVVCVWGGGLFALDCTLGMGYTVVQCVTSLQRIGGC